MKVLMELLDSLSAEVVVKYGEFLKEQGTDLPLKEAVIKASIKIQLCFSKLNNRDFEDVLKAGFLGLSNNFSYKENTLNQVKKNFGYYSLEENKAELISKLELFIENQKSEVSTMGLLESEISTYIKSLNNISDGCLGIKSLNEAIIFSLGGIERKEFIEYAINRLRIS